MSINKEKTSFVSPTIKKKAFFRFQYRVLHNWKEILLSNYISTLMSNLLSKAKEDVFLLIIRRINSRSISLTYALIFLWMLIVSLWELRFTTHLIQNLTLLILKWTTLVCKRMMRMMMIRSSTIKWGCVWFLLKKYSNILLSQMALITSV